MPKYKSFAVKSDGISEDGGTITGYASTWDREPDSYGDVVAKGAFEETLKAWGERDVHIPFLFCHRTDDPMYNIGWCEAEEDERGLKFIAHLDRDSENAQYVRKLYKEGRIYQFSFAYEILDAAEIELEDGRNAFELRKLNLFEISAVQIPANQHAEVTEVKTAVEALAKAGRRNSKSDEATIRQAINLLQSLLDEETNDEPEDTNEPEDQDDANEPDDPTKDGEGVATPEGCEVDESVRLEAYRKALLGASEG